MMFEADIPITSYFAPISSVVGIVGGLIQSNIQSDIQDIQARSAAWARSAPTTQRNLITMASTVRSQLETQAQQSSSILPSIAGITIPTNILIIGGGLLLVLYLVKRR